MTTHVSTDPTAVPAASTAASWNSAAATVSRGTSVAALATSLPWQTIGAGERVDARGIVAAAAPLLAQARPRPNLRWPAIGILVTVFMDIATTLLLGGPVSLSALALRVGTGAATSLFGGIAGKSTGPLRKLTGIMSIVYGVVQLVTLGTAAWAALATPVQLITLVPSIVVILSSLVLSVTTTIGALKR